MPVIYSDRTLPLSKNASKPEFSTGLVLAWDFTGVGALADGEPWIYKGATKPTLVKSGTQTLTTLGGEPGRVPAASANYDYTNATDYGLQVGNGDFTLAIRFSTGAALPTTALTRTLLSIRGGSSALTVSLSENPNIGWYIVMTGSTSVPFGSTSPPEYFPTDTIGVVFVQRIAGITRVYTANATTGADAQIRYNPGAANTTPMDSSWASRALVNSSASGVTTTPALQSIRFWDVGLDTATITAMGKDYWSAETNAAVADSIAITAPATGATISTTSVISGTYVGVAPNGVEVRHGTGAWVAGTSMTISGGAWSGNFTLPAGASGSLTARESNNTAVVSPAITGVTVAAPASSITFTAPDGVTSAKPFRMFQRNGSDAASVRVSGTYVGTPTTLQYRWDGSAWATLVASPSGGAFDTTITLQGPAQGALEVRFSNATSVFASLEAVGVGDVYLVLGQSNHVGGGDGSAYVAAAAPTAHPGWKAPIYAKNGVWRENVETALLPFSDTTGAVYASQASSPTARASYFGRLATLCMAEGVPVAFVPCAIGSTSIANWNVSTATSTLYGAAVAAATAIGAHKAVLWWQGEADTSNGSTRSYYETELNARVSDWSARFSRPWILMNLNATGNTVGSGGTGPTDTGFNAIHAAIAAVAATNANVAAIGDMNGAFSGSVHYSATAEINNVAAVAFGAIDSAYNYSGADITAPVLSGAITESAVTSSGLTFSWPAATGDVAGYETSINGGTTYTDRGNVLSRAETGLAASTAYPLRVRAYDLAGNYSAVLSKTVTTLAAADTTAPVLTGTITESAVTSSGFTFACPAATGDPVGYESSIDGGATWVDSGTTRTRTVTGRPASTAHACRWRSYDGATPRNVSAELSKTITTLAAAATVTGVSVSPTTATGSQTFTASVSGTNSPSQSVTWSASAGTISSAGVFTAPAATTSEQVITITAQSVADTTKTGTATVTIAAVASPAEGIQVGLSCTVNFGGTNRQSAGDPSFKNNKWLVPKDPDDKRWYKYGLAKDLTEAGTTASIVTAIFDGVEVLVPPAIQGTDVVVKLGGLDLAPNAENFCTIRAICANGEQIDRTMHFVREDH